MSSQPKIWHGAVCVGSARACNECGITADVLFEIGQREFRSSGPGQWACRACVLDSARAIASMDRRGDMLGGNRIARELDAAVAIAIHLENQVRSGDATAGAGALARSVSISHGPSLNPRPLPVAYMHVLAVLDRCRRADTEFSTAITELHERYEHAAFFSPKQTLLVQWRLAENGITHDPGYFVVSTRTDKEIAQIRGFDDWRKKKIAPYLSWAQRSRFGF